MEENKETVTIEVALLDKDIEDITITNVEIKEKSVTNLGNRPSERSGQYGQKGLTAVEIKEKYSELPIHIAVRFNTFLQKLSQQIIPEIKGRDVKSISFNADGGITITHSDDTVTKTESHWLTDVSSGGSLPPTAEAVREYVLKYASDVEDRVSNVETELGGKITRVPITDPNVRETHYVYGENSEERDNVFKFGVEHAFADAFTIARRDENGNIKVETPIADKDAANKDYVDENTIGSVEFNDKDFTITFKKPNGETLKTIDLPTESLVSKIEFNKDTKKLKITLQNGTSTEIPATGIFNPAWVEDISIGGNTPPTAKAVKDYVDEKASAAETAAQRSLDKKVPITKNDYEKVVTVGAEGNLDAIDPRTTYRHEMHIKSSQYPNRPLDIYCAFYNAKRTPTTNYYDFLDKAIGEGGIPCQGAVGTEKATRFTYEDRVDENTPARIVITDNSNNEHYFTQWTLTDSVPEYDVGEIKSDVTEVKSDVEDITRRVDNLEDVLVEEKVVTSDKYVTPVPENVGRYALLNEVGGITHRVEKVLRSFGDGESLTGWGIADTSPLSEAFSINVKPPFFLVADEIYGDIGFYVCDANTTNFFEPLDNSRLKGNGEARYNTECEKYTLYQYSGEGGAFRYKNLRLCTYELQDAKVTAIESKGKNLAKIHGFSARGDLSEPQLSNDYGTTISTTEPANSIAVTQSAFDKNVDYYGYKNGYFYIEVDTDLQEGEEFTFSCDVKVTNNLSGRTAMIVRPNSIGTLIITDITTGRIVAKGLWKFSEDRELIGIRLNGISAVFSNFMLERGHTDGTYVPYREPITYTLPEAITNDREEYGLGATDEYGTATNAIDFENKKFYPKRVRKITFDGSENYWFLESINDAGLANFGYTFDVAITHTGVCNHFSRSEDRIFNATSEGVIYSLSAHTSFFRVFNCQTVDEWKSKLAEWAANGNPLTVVCGFDDDTAEDIDIDDNVIEVEPGGSLVAVNEYGLDAPTKISYIVAKGGNV